MRYAVTVLWLILCICFVKKSGAQQQVFFNNLTEKDGLSNNRVTCFFKDKTGYIWIGTESGLNRYNGNSWKIYKPSRQKKNYISNSFITAIQQDKNGDMWVATRKGLNRINIIQGTTDIFLPQEGNHNSIPSDYILDVYPDTDGSVWIAADAKDFCRYNSDTKKFFFYGFKQFLQENHSEINPGYHSIFRILPKSATELWLATTDGIFIFNKPTGRFSLYAGISLSDIRFFFFDEHIQKLYCVDQANKLYCFGLLQQEMDIIPLEKEKYANTPVSLGSLAGKILLVPANEGVAGVNENNEVLFFAKGVTEKEYALLPGKATCIYKDRQDITWIGTNNGISKFIPAFNRNLHILPGYDIGSLQYPAIKNFTYNRLAGEWLITSWKNNVIFSANSKTGAVATLNRPAVYRSDTCYAFYTHNSDSIFLLGNGALLLLNCRSGKWDKIFLPLPVTRSALVSMVIDAYGSYWLINIHGEIFVYNPVSKIVQGFPKSETGNSNSCIAEDRKNNCMWIGSTGYGLFRYNFSDKKFTLLETNNKIETALHSYIINDVLPDGNGNVWVATFEGGLAKYNSTLPPDKGFKNYSSMEDMPDDNIYGLAPDGKGGVWFTSIKGIGHITADGNRKELYNQQNGLPYSKFIQSIAALPDGRIAAISENNFICFNPAESNTAYNNFPVTIDDVFVNDTLPIGNDTGTSARRFGYRQNAFTFHFAVLDFTSPGAVGYYYMLEGLDKDWVYAGAQHSIRYSKLQPGGYTFKLKARRENGEFYTQQAAFPFHIAAPFWQQAWFTVLLLLGITGGIYWLVQRRIKFIRQQAELKHKIAETEMMALRAQMNPHFIFNCLNAIDNLVQTNQKEKATTYLARFAKLIRNVLDSSKNNVVLFQKDFESLQLYLEMEQFRCNHKFTCQLTADPELLHSDYRIPPLIIQPFVENAIHHGLLNKEHHNRRLTVKATLQDDIIQYSITDNGVGRVRAMQIKELNKPGQEPYGIKITKERIQLYNRSNTTGDIIITDLWENGQPAGTKVDIQLKIYTGK